MIAFVVVCFRFLSVVLYAFDSKEQRRRSVVSSHVMQNPRNLLNIAWGQTKITLICLPLTFTITMHLEIIRHIDLYCNLINILKYL